MNTKRKKTGRKLLSFLLTLAMVVGLMPGMSLTAYAADNAKYREYAWNETSKTLSYEDKDIPVGVTELTTDTVSWTEGGWYIVPEEGVTIGNRITVTGTVNLILRDGATLTASKGITVNSGNTINIYAQIGGTGELNAGSDTSVASIGGGARYQSSGTVNIHGGKITATGGSNASGIGGATDGGNGEVNIYSGEVTARGQNFAAGIGGYSGKSGGTVNIYGGTVNASGSNYGTTGIGIGGIKPGSCVVHIYGGEVTATSEKAAAGIQGTVTIDDGTVTANGGGASDSIDCYSGETYSSNGINGTVTVNGGTVTATGGNVTVTGGYAGAIESYGGTIYACSGIGGTVTISGGTVTATGGNVTGDINNYGGTIYACNGVNGTVTISGGTVTATGGSHTGQFSSNGGTTVKEKGFGGSLTIGDIMKVLGGDSADPTTEIEKSNDDYARFKYMLVKLGHVHSFTYEANDATIKATCSQNDCTLNDGQGNHTAILTIGAPTLNTYGQTGAGISAEATITDADNIKGTATVVYKKGDETLASAPTDAGTYTASITLGTVTASVEYTIAQKEVTVSGITASDKIYAGNTDATLVTTAAAFTGKLDGDTLTVSATGTFDNANVGENKTVTISNLTLDGTSKDNYVLAATGQQTTTTAKITAREIGLIWSDTELTYTGEAQKPTATATGVVEGDTCTVIVSGEQTNIGDNYTATAESLSNSNYKLPENKTTTFKIVKGNAVAATVTANNRTYDGTEKPLVTVTGTVTGGTMQYALGDANEATQRYTTSIPTGTDAGTYYVWYKVVGDGNHQDYIPTSPVTVTIEQATVNLTWGTTKFTYDGTDKLPTAEITTGIVGDDDCTVEVSGEQTDVNIGDSTYTATAKLTGNDSANYKIAEADKTTTFTINAKAMTVTAADVEVTYDGKEHKITVNVADPADATITYKKAGDTEYSIANPTFTDAGEYEVSYKVTKANYTEFTGTATVKINKKAALTVTADAKNITYGDEDVVLTYKVEGLTGSDKAEDVLTGALTREAGTDAGTYKIEQGSLTSAEYGIAFVGADYVIAKASQAAPAESFTISKATGSDTIDGKISGFAGTKTYQISSDNGATWTDVKAGETSLVVKAGVYQIRYAGDKNHEAGASVSVTVGKKADQSKPEGLEAVNVSAEDAKDGEITGVSDTMEYSVDKGTTWKAVPANADKIDGLAAGAVLVRYAETDDKNAGSNTTVTVGVASKTEGVVEFKPEEGGTDVEEKAITGVDNESTKASVDDFAETQQEEGKDVKVALEITPQKEENVNKESVEETNKVVEEVFAGIDSEKVVTEYLAIDVAKYVDNVKETENISDTKSPLEIALKFDSKKSNPVVVRTHDGKAKAFGKLRSRPAKKDYKDAMFYIDPENAILYIYSQYFSDFAIVYATETTYNVGFVSGTGVNLSPLVVAEGGKVTLPTGLKNDGYAFDGWYQDEAYKTAWKDSDTVNADITLYAKWNKSVSGVSVSPSEAMFTKAGETSQIKTTVTPADAANTKVTYKSSDTNVATVDANGKITAVANGTATITVTTEDGAKTATVKVTVSIPEVKQQGTEEPVQQPTKEEKAVISMNAGLKISQTGSKINIKWGKVGEADGYDVYVAYRGKKFGKAVKTINKNSTTSVTVKKINGKKINLKKNFKVYVAAYKMTDGKKEVLAKSIMGHVVGRLNTRYSNVRKITLSKSKYSVKVGKTVKVKAKTVLVDKSKKQLSDAHAAQFRYASSNRNIATVDKNGKVKGVAKGTCTIYVYARNGYAKTVKVTVK